MNKAPDFKGLWPALFTPVTENGKVNEKELEKMIELIIAQKLDGIYLLGSTGQGFLYSEAERMHIAELSIEITNKRLPLIVQVGAMCTDESVRLARHAASKGADGISSVGPIYYASSPLMGMEHYRKIATATDLPFFPYQIGNTPMTDDMIRQLLEMQNVKGLKLTTGDMLEISTINIKSKRQWILFSGADELVCHAAVCGTAGAIGSTYNLFGPVCQYVRREFVNGNVKLGIEFMLEFQGLILEILPCIWTFFRRGMLLRHGIDIGNPKAPLQAPELKWSDDELMNRIRRVESFLPSA
ncbi:MAG TPA: dihydrodipicolinate synthase family protein [Chitinophagaceae bacterium]|nr:dihydrodipicolinate synthase family protein [Chitinophagaceae bacterium]